MIANDLVVNNYRFENRLWCRVIASCLSGLSKSLQSGGGGVASGILSACSVTLHNWVKSLST